MGYYFVKIPSTCGSVLNQGSAGGCARSISDHGPAERRYLAVSLRRRQPPIRWGQKRLTKARKVVLNMQEYQSLAHKWNGRLVLA